MKKTLKSLQEEVTKLKKIGKEYAQAAKNRVVSRPYHYEVNPVDATANQTPVAKVAELYAHVQTASKLGYETMLESDDSGRLQVVFMKKLPETPYEFWF